MLVLKKYMSLFILAFSLQMGAQEQDTCKDKWGLPDIFNGATVVLLKTLIKEMYPGEKPMTPLAVQLDTSLCKEEQRFLQNRLPIIQNNLKTHFDITQPLRIAFCCSGGGNRAMIGALGFLTGAAKSHILDSSLYISGLSGSTWLISQFCFLAATTYKKHKFEDILLDIKNSYKMNLHDYSMLGMNGVYAPPLISFDSTDDVCIEIAKRFAYEQPMTLVNLFGALVGDYALSLMGNDRLSEKWSRIIYEIQKGTIPLPLCASIFEKSKSHYGWFEMSPLQCGSTELGYIPVQYLGSKFVNGILQEDHICPEYPLSFYLGMYGSAFAATIQDIANIQKELHRTVTILKEQSCPDQEPQRNILNNSFVQSLIQGTIQDIISSRNAITYAQFPNFSKDVETTALSEKDTIGLFDAGIDFDLPLPLLIDRSERSLDLIFLYGSFPGKKSVLIDLAKYCHRKKIGFPDISMIGQEDVEQNDMIVLNDPRGIDYDSAIPTYIYFSTNNINVYSTPYITLNFRYTPEDVDSLSDKTEQMFLSHQNDIVEILKTLAKKRYIN